MSGSTYSTFCSSAANQFCSYGFLQPNNEILITIHAATDGWAALGTGQMMDGSDMYVVYKKDNKCVVSRRKGNGYLTPTPISDQIAKIVEQVPKEAAPPLEPWAKLACSFTRPIGTDNAFVNSAQSYIWGIGPVSGDNIQPHAATDASTGSTNFLQAGLVSTGSAIAAPFINSDPDTYNLVIFAHGILFFLAWAVAPFIGIFIARYLKDVLGVWWYKLHLYIMFGVTGGFSLISLILIVLYKQHGHITDVHEYIGVTVCVLLLLQIILGFVSNALWSPDRTFIPWWDKAHWWFGRIVVILGISNVYLGIMSFHQKLGITNHTSLFITFSVIIGIGVLSLIVGQFVYGQVHHLKEHDEDYEMYGKK